MKPVTRLTYSGVALPLSTTTYTLFDSTTIIPTSKSLGVLQSAGVTRFGWSIVSSHDGLIVLSGTNDGTTFTEVTRVQVDGGTGTPNRGSFSVEGFKGFKVEWINGGTNQTTFIPQLYLGDDDCAAGDQVVEGQAASTQAAVATANIDTFAYDARNAATGGVGNPARAFIVLDATTGQTVAYVDASGNTTSIDVTGLVGVRFDVQVDTFTASTNVDQLLVMW